MNNSKVWDEVCKCTNGLAAVRVGNKWNYIDQKGSLLSDVWFDHCSGFYMGLAKVSVNGWEGLMNENGIICAE